MVGLHRNVTLSFMLVGHTKFSPDWCFGLLKQRYRRTYVSSLQDITRVVTESADVNEVQLVGTEDGTVLVPVYNWADFFSRRFHKVPRMKSYHHFSFSSSTPGVVTLKEYSDSESSTWCLLSDPLWAPTAEELPVVIPPSGLSLQRQWYLHKEIREFCRPGTEDLVCPLPASPLGMEQPVQHQPDREQPVQLQLEREVGAAPPAKRVRRCGLCGTPGHTRQTCERRHQ